MPNRLKPASLASVVWPCHVTQLFNNERELRRFAVLPSEDRILAAAAAGRAWCVEELFAQGCPIDGKYVRMDNLDVYV